MTGMKMKIASLLLMLTLIMCQMPAMVFANDVLADVPPADQQEQTSGQDDQNDKNDQNGQPADNQEIIANAGGNEEGTDGQNGDDVSKEQTTGSDASGTDETNGGDNKDLSDDVDDVNKTDVPAQKNGMKTLSGESKDGDKETNLTVKSASFYAVVLEGGSVSVENPKNSKIESIDAGKFANLLDDTWLQFAPGETAKMTATPASGYEFGGWYKNWNESSRQLYSSAATINYALPESGSDSLTAYFKPASVTSINKVTAYIINPETGRTAAQTTPSNCVSFPPYYNTHCMVNAASAGFVTDETGSQAYTGIFESGKTYYLKFTIDANDGYIFSDSVEKEIYTATLVNTSLSEDKKHLTLTVSFTPRDVTGNLLDKVDLKLTPPEEGKKATDVSATSAIAKTGNNDIQISKVAWVQFDPSEPKYEGNAPFTGTFAKGNTYYLEVRLVDGTNDKLAARAGGNSFDTEITVSEGGSKVTQGGGAFAEESDTYIFQSAVISFTPSSPDTGYEDVWVDNTVDNSVSKISGIVHLTGSGGTQAGYDPAKTVYGPESVSVPFSTPETDAVKAKETAAYNEANTKATEVKSAGARGEYHMSTSLITNRVWDNRRYETTYSVIKGPGITTPIPVTRVGDTDTYKDASDNTYTPENYRIRRTHTASGDYGKETIITVQANGWVSGYDITVSDDGKGSATADPAASLSGKSISIKATPKTNYVFDKWVVVSGGAAIKDVNKAETTFVMPKNNVEVKATFKHDPSHGTLENTPKEYPTCTAEGTEEYWTCPTCHKMFSDAEGTKEITKPKTIPALGHDWKVVERKDPTETEEGYEKLECQRPDCGAHEERTIPKLVVEYSFVSGSGSSWTRGSTEKLNFVVKRNRADETTVDHFKGLKVDGKDVPSSGYAAKAGSVVIDLMPAYLGTLADGDHTLTAVFDDGNKETSASFKVLSAADKGSKDKANSNKKGSPATGDESRVLVWLMILCTAGLALSDRIIRRLKNDSADR